MDPDVHPVLIQINSKYRNDDYIKEHAKLKYVDFYFSLIHAERVVKATPVKWPLTVT